MVASAAVRGNLDSLAFVGPELALVLAFLAVIIWDLLAKGHRARVIGHVVIALAGLAYSAIGAAAYLALGDQLAPQELFHGLLAFDHFGQIFRILFALVTAIILIVLAPRMLAPGGKTGESRDPGEMVALLLAVTVGMNLMAASRHLLMSYLSLEMVSVLSFVLAGFKLKDRRSSEGALKYVIFGGVASGVMLYGMSWMYGLTGSLRFGEIQQALSLMSAEQGHFPQAAFVAVICMLAGFGYKISAAPFHMWTPDVYQGAPTAVTAFLSVGPKAAGLALLIRFFSDALGMGTAGGLEASGQAPWHIVAGSMAMATMIVGNLTALNQPNIKRMLAFSSIAHAGYMLLGFAVFTEAGIAAIVFYLAAYCFMNLGAFLVVMSVSEGNGGDESLESFKGLGRRAPLMAITMTVFLVSLAGIPPLAGFVGKFYIFTALLKVGGNFNWMLAVVGVLNSVVSLFYYARVIRAMYLDEVAGTERIEVRRAFSITSLSLAVPTVALGIYWAPLYDFVARSLQMVR